MSEILAILATSDATSDNWYAVLTTDVSHFAIGFLSGVLVWLADYAAALVLIALGGWIGKELFGDLLGAGFTRAAIVDSAKDIGLAVIGFIACSFLISAVGRAR